MKKYILSIFLPLLLFCGATAFAITLIPVPQGGTGAGTFTSGHILTGNGLGAITTTDPANWNTAYGWGDHSIQNYFDTDTQTLDNIPDGTTYKLLTATKNNYVNQDVTNGSSPTFLTPTISGSLWDGVTIATSSDILNLWNLDELKNVNTDGVANGYILNYQDGWTSISTLFIDESGNVGIGTENPSARLHINYPTSGDVIFQAGTGDGSSDMNMRYGYNGYGWYNKYLGSGSGDNNEWQLWSEGAGSTDMQVYGIKQSGNITFMKDMTIEGTLTLNTPLTDAYVSDDLTVNGYMEDTDIDTFAELQSWAVGYTDNDTTYTAGGTLLDLTGTTFSLNEGTLTDTKLCTYEASSGLVCNHTDADTTYTSSDFNHDDLTGYVVNEHIDWTTDQGATNIHSGNYTDNDTTYTGGTGLTLTTGTFSVDTSQNIATLSNLTDNGFIKTSGGTGALSIDTSTYLTTVDISANTNLAVTAPVVLTDDTLSVSASSDTASGIVELATTAETTTGTDTGRAITPDGLAGSSIFGRKTVELVPIAFDADTEIADGIFYFHIPASLNGMNLVSVHGLVVTAGTTGTTDWQLYNLTDSQNMLSTKLTIDSGETGSDTAATPAVINTSYDDVATNDVIRLDCDAVSTTKAKGTVISLEFALP